MNKEWALTKEAFDKLLDWLDTDRERAGSTYENIRLRLIKIFARRGCGEAEDLADETINRVTAKIERLSSQYEGNPALYFYGVAQKVHLEYLRSQHKRLENRPVETEVDDEAEYECLDQCMQRLPLDNQNLVLRYYRDDKQAKIINRKQLADELGIAVNALRIRAHRIRVILQQCIEGCVQGIAAN
jgi:DNA-directed RNA polymerase specialized sigma24 family protein